MQTKSDQIRHLVREGVDDLEIAKLTGAHPAFVRKVRSARMDKPARYPSQEHLRAISKAARKRWKAYREARA
jgi:hypothetical protein